MGFAHVADFWLRSRFLTCEALKAESERLAKKKKKEDEKRERLEKAKKKLADKETKGTLTFPHLWAVVSRV